MLWACTSGGCWRLACRRCRLPPEQNMPPAPVMTTLRTSGLRSATLSASMHAAPMEGSIALRRPGLLRVSTSV